jgi:hypothetical protein
MCCKNLKVFWFGTKNRVAKKKQQKKKKPAELLVFDGLALLISSLL